MVVALLIGANFLTNMVEKEIDPAGTKYKAVFEVFELFYNICFTIELIINAYAHWFWPFWKSSWNVFDCIVVTIGVVNTLNLPLPPALSLLRMMRAFRVFRLFKRVRSLNKIIVAIVHAVPGVVNAFLILTIVMSIYAILAVEFYQNIGVGCTKEFSTHKWLKTARENCVGYEYFGRFTLSLYTFFQVLTGESWSEAVARPAMWEFYYVPLKSVSGGFFYVSFVLISSFILTNVVVAVLLDKFSDPEVTAKLDEGDKPDELADADGQDGDGKEGVPCQEVVEHQTPTTNVNTKEDLKKSIDAVDQQVEELMVASNRMAEEVDTVRSEMGSIREQVLAILQCVPGGELEILRDQAFSAAKG
jgi:hypothetical protein